MDHQPLKYQSQNRLYKLLMNYSSRHTSSWRRCKSDSELRRSTVERVLLLVDTTTPEMLLLLRTAPAIHLAIRIFQTAIISSCSSWDTTSIDLLKGTMSFLKRPYLYSDPEWRELLTFMP